jgi:hypothetical protein
VAHLRGYRACLLIFTVWAVTCLEGHEKGEHSVGDEEVASHTRLLQQTRLNGHKKPGITGMSEAKPTGMHPLKSQCNHVLEDLNIGLVDVFFDRRGRYVFLWRASKIR